MKRFPAFSYPVISMLNMPSQMQCEAVRKADLVRILEDGWLALHPLEEGHPPFSLTVFFIEILT